jgi:hypothetical protein
MSRDQIHVGRSETIEAAASLLCQKSPTFAESGGAEVRIGGVKYLDFITRRAVILLGPTVSSSLTDDLTQASCIALN